MIRLSLGAYAVDALDPAEQTRIGAHLKCCADCQGELAQLKDVAGLLVNLPLGEVERAGTVGAHEYETTGERRRQRSRRTRMGRAVAPLAGVAALVAAVVALVGPWDGHRSQPQRVSLSASGRDRVTHAFAQVTLRQDASGTAAGQPSGTAAGQPSGTAAGQPVGTTATLSLRGVRPHLRCRLVVHALNGTSVIAATYRADNKGTADLTARSVIPINEIASLEVLAGRKDRIVQIPVHGSRTNA